MNIIRPLLATLLVFSIGCVAASSAAAGRNYTKRLEKYELAIRWSEFDAATKFEKPAGKDDAWSRAADEYRDIRVADYVVKDQKYQKDPKQVLQTVEILYYKVNNPTIRSLIDRQRWEYDADEKEWYLTTGLPAFQ